MRLDDLKRVDEAIVCKAGVRAARLVRDAGGVTFTYLDDYDGPDVAWTLPRTGLPVRLTGGALPPFFSGLLPEGRRLGALRRAVKTSADDELTLLLAVGNDTIGDVRVLPATTNPLKAETAPDDAPRPDAPLLADADFAELFAGVLAPAPRDRVGLAGVQDKVSGRLISLPVRHADAAWILKLDPPDVPHLVRNEAFFLAAARHSGLEVAQAEVIHDRTGRPGLLVRRFDRERTTHGSVAHAQEDACQVLGRYPADKYRLTSEELVAGLAQRTGAPIVAARTLLQQLAFAYLSCNGDAHGKNFSIVQRAGEWRVTPAYDLPSSHPYGDTTMALTIAGKDREDIGRADFLALGEACGVPTKATARALDSLLATMPTWLDRLEELPFDARRIHGLRQACRYRAERLG